MQKVARKPSSDPVQEKLRQDKANFNKQVSEFINDLIHFKKTMNGWPSKFYKERSKIIEPIPADPKTIIGSLAGDFQEIASKGNSIIQEQLNYAKNRKQRQIANPSQNSSKQLELGLNANEASNYYLISEASNPLTRFFTKLLNPGFGSSEDARIKKYRKSLLNSTAEIYKNLKKLQEAIVDSNDQSIFIASQLMDKIENDWSFVVSGFNVFQSTLPDGAPESGGKISSPKEENETNPKIQQAEQAILDIHKFSNYSNEFKELLSAENAGKIFFKDKNVKNAEHFLNLYNQALSSISSKLNLPPQNSFQDLAILYAQNPKMEVVAQNFLGKLKHQFLPSKTSAFRLDIYNLAKNSRELVDNVMDLLEEGLDIKALNPVMGKIGTNFLNIRQLINSLSSINRGKGYQSQFMNMLNKYDIDLDNEQKKNLEKMLKQKQLRDLAKIYEK